MPKRASQTPFASEDAHSTDIMRSEASSDAEAFSCCDGLSERTQGGQGRGSDLEPRAVRHTLACLLARIAGRSPLEYLDNTARLRQREAVLAIISNPPTNILDLINQFVARL